MKKNKPDIKTGRVYILNNKKVRFISSMLKDVEGVYLTGGAPIDIMEGRDPKDFDLYAPDKFYQTVKKLESKHCTFVRETKFASTFVKGGVTIQVLKERKLENLGDFTISTSLFNLISGTLEIEEDCYNNSLLVPCDMEDIDRVLNSLSRIPHWKKKGYNISDELYLELINKVNTNIQERKNRKFFGIFNSSCKNHIEELPYQS